MAFETATTKRWSARPNKFIVQYNENLYDLTEFVHKHPGGLNTLRGVRNADMTTRFLSAPTHSKAALYLLNEYQIKERTRKQIDDAKKDGINGNKIEQIIAEGTNSNLLDYSMEHIVDWSKAMVPQISKITQHYDEWVHKPVDRPLILFSSWYLEMCTKTPWYIIPAFWIPVIISCVSHEFSSCWSDANFFKIYYLTLYFLAGILLWTFVEYSLHRWVFHMKIGHNRKAWICTLHFLIHGLHHKVPFDPQRLVFPPIPAILIACIFYLPLHFLLPYPRIVLGGGLFGYVCYDLMHYYLHYGSPTIQHLYHMKRYHFQHHFAHQDMGFGISSTLWDIIFHTRIKLRKLGYQLIWRQ